MIKQLLNSVFPKRRDFFLHSICIDLTSYLPSPSLINSAQSSLRSILVYGKDNALWQFRLKLIIDRWDLPYNLRLDVNHGGRT